MGNILLENGTNEFEVLEFLVGKHRYGINVAKVKEIIPYKEPTDAPGTNPAVEGFLMPRDVMLTIINLKNALELNDVELDAEKDFLIITNFNNLNMAFRVTQVVGIRRFSWADIMSPTSVITTEDRMITGVIKYDDKLVVILDFENLVNHIAPETSLKLSEVEQYANDKATDIPIFVAEDSGLLQKMIVDSLHKSGYTNITAFNNGKECYDRISQIKESNPDGILNEIKCVITDIEMPIMDGHRLTKLIKEDNVLSKIPVVIFSSLINDEMRIKGEQLGANAQLSKPEIGQLVGTLKKILK